MSLMGERHSKYDRADNNGFYVEVDWCVHALLARGKTFLGKGIHDPCAGHGTIVDAALARGFDVTGADICDHAAGRFPGRDFLADTATYPNIVTNPPDVRGAAIVARALNSNLVAGGKVAVLVPLGFLASAKQFGLFNRGEFDELLILSRRQSMPPSRVRQRAGESCRHLGRTDFCWAVWQRGRIDPTPPRILWVRP
jgi:hypothetical protein